MGPPCNEDPNVGEQNLIGEKVDEGLIEEGDGEDPFEKTDGTEEIETFSDFKPTYSLKWWIRRSVGMIFIMATVITWVVSSILTQYTLSDGFDSPFFLTYFMSASFVVYLPVCAMSWSIQKSTRFIKQQKLQRMREAAAGTDEVLDATDEKLEASSLVLESSNVITTAPSPVVMQLTFSQHFKLAMFFGHLWFFANFTFNLSLNLTTVTSNTIITTTSGLFALVFSAILRIDTFSPLKALCVFLSISGVVLVAFADSDSNGSDSLIGDILAFVSAIAFALYCTLLKWKLVDEDRLNSALFLGLIAVWNSATLVVLFPILHFLGIEDFVVPTLIILLLLFANAVIGNIITDWLYIRSVLLTTPLIVTTCMSMTIPVAALTDVIRFPDDVNLTIWYFIGVALVFASFVTVQIAEPIDKYAFMLMKRSRERLVLWYREKKALPFNEF